LLKLVHIRAKHLIFLISCMAISIAALAGYDGQAGALLCENNPDYYCMKVFRKSVGTGFAEPDWKEVFPDRRERELVMKVNRMNTPLKSGIKIAVPRGLADKDMMDLSPFPKKRDTGGEKLIIFDPRAYAFAAYDEEGKLVRWGPAVGGRAGLWTPAGNYRINSKGGPDCRSSIYPEGCSGRSCSAMPYCMEFRHGCAFHAGDLPGRHASHGCVRLFYDDAKWLNTEFAKIGTRVLVGPY